MKKKLILFSILIVTILLSANVSAQFLRWDWWKQNPALSLIGFNNTLNPTFANVILQAGPKVSALIEKNRDYVLDLIERKVAENK